MNNHVARSRCTAVFSGFALAFVVIAADAAMDQGREAAFEKEKRAYIRQYATPKRVTASDNEILFAKKERSKPIPGPTKDQPPVPSKESTPAPESTPPEPIEGQ